MLRTDSGETEGKRKRTAPDLLPEQSVPEGNRRGIGDSQKYPAISVGSDCREMWKKSKRVSGSISIAACIIM